MVSAALTPAQRLVRALLGLVLLALYLLLGHAVSSAPPSAFDLATQGWVGTATPVAVVLTESGLLPTLVCVGIAGLLVGWYYPAWRSRAIFAVVMNLVAWKTSDVFKTVFDRPRPGHWIVFHETSASYSSGHACNALVVYGLWAYFVWRSDLPQPWRAVLAGALALWGLGISWSRLALGAHFPTDVLGGWLLGGALLAFGFAIYDPIPQPRRGPGGRAGRTIRAV